MEGLQIPLHRSEILPLNRSPSRARPFVVRALLKEMPGCIDSSDVGHGALQALAAPRAQPATALADLPAGPVPLSAPRAVANTRRASDPQTSHAQSQPTQRPPRVAEASILPSTASLSHTLGGRAPALCTPNVRRRGYMARQKRHARDPETCHSQSQLAQGLRHWRVVERSCCRAGLPVSSAPLSSH